jgi:sarcosine oxidase, subunit alpha
MDVLIIGAGPAGLSSGIACAEQGLTVKIVDEFVKPGGRLLGQLHQEPNGEWRNGIDEAKQLYEKATRFGIEIECGTSVYNIEKMGKGWRVYTSKEVLDVPSLLLATGAAEKPNPIPGWTLPGVMSIGAAQVMTNVHRVRVGQQGIVIGINVLSLAITRELQLAGLHLQNMLLPAKNMINQEAGNPEKTFDSLLRLAPMAPSPLIRFASRFLTTKRMKRSGLKFYPKNGYKIWGVPIQLKTAAIEIYGQNQVEGVRVVDISLDGTPIPGTQRDLSADFVCIAGGLYPLAELAAIAGCPFHYIPELGGHIPLHNTKMQTPLQGLYVAGNITGIESAKVAMAQGIVAGLSIACNAGICGEEKLLQAMKNVEHVRRKATIQFHPSIQEGRKKITEIYSVTCGGL